MEKRTGPIQKMHTRADETVRYALPVGESRISLNPLIGGPIRFRYTGRIFCIHCGKATKTSFSQGYCFRCMQTLAQCDMCIVKPELCHHHLGTCREPEWGTAHCMIDHTVYLANSSGIKVGITRSHQMKTRWMDQGAVQALPIVRVRNRLESGRVEVALAKVLPDKTNWRLMLQGKGEVLDLKARRDEVFAGLSAELPGERLAEEEYRFEYPVLVYPAKLTSLNLDKQPEVSGNLQGIKGQYLILSTGVINMRKYGGYELEWESESIVEEAGQKAVEKAVAREVAKPVAPVSADPAIAQGPMKAAAGDAATQTSLI